MSILSRIKNIWELSEYHPGSKEEEEKGMEVGTKVAMIVKPPSKKENVFIPRVAHDPIKAITEENNDN